MYVGRNIEIRRKRFGRLKKKYYICINMENTIEKQNTIIVRMMREEKVISANEITAEAANEMKDFITEIFTNKTGGLTIILEVRLFNKETEDTDAAE